MQTEHPDRYPRSLKVCTVVNFPSGQEATEKVVQDTKAAVQDGADEVDVVINYRLLIENKQEGCKAAQELVKAVRAECPQGQVALKVIIESGELGNEELIVAASEAAIAGGCDFVKTSTGKVKVNATPEAAEAMLKVVAASGKAVGFKAAGGVRDAAQARQYLELTARILLGDARRHHEVDARQLRFGASSLLPALRACATSASAAAGTKRKADVARCFQFCVREAGDCRHSKQWEEQQQCG
jgi:deoxyribose-phosphate aldolase